MKKRRKDNNLKAWLYLLPAILFLGVFMVYPLVDVCIYSLEEGYKVTTDTFTGIGLGNFVKVLHDEEFVQALINTFELVIITVPVSTGLSLLIALGLSSIKPLKKAFQTIFFLPYVTNTLAVGLVFTFLFAKTDHTVGLVNELLGRNMETAIDFFDKYSHGWQILVTSLYTVWIVMPFKILILTSALASVNQDYYKAAKVDGASSARIFRKITLPMISPTVFYLIITGFIGAFKAYSDEVALFGENLKGARLNTIVGYIYDFLTSETGGQYGEAAAAALILFVIILTITVINLRFSRNKVQYM